MNQLGIRFIGPTNRVSGLAVSCRGYIEAIKTTSYPIDIVCVKQGFAHQKKIASYSSEYHIPSDYDVLSIVHMNPDVMHLYSDIPQKYLTNSSYRVGIWYWELSRLPPLWFKYIDCFDELWVASTFTQRAIQACTNIPVVVIPPSVEKKAVDWRKVNVFKVQYKLENYRCVFLYIFDMNSYMERKNPFALVNAFVDTFKGCNDAALILKVSNGWISADFQKKIKQICEAMPNVIIIDKIMSDSDIVALHGVATCYVSPHRSEGFGLTIIEAMMAKKVIVATDYGATTDFIGRDTAFPVDYSLIEIKETMGPYEKGYVWADINQSDLIKKMEAVYLQSSDITDKIDKAYLSVVDKYSPSCVGEIITKRMKSLGL